jgi:hypothetical protein
MTLFIFLFNAGNAESEILQENKKQRQQSNT